MDARIHNVTTAEEKEIFELLGDLYANLAVGYFAIIDRAQELNISRERVEQLLSMSNKELKGSLGGHQ